MTNKREVILQSAIVRIAEQGESFTTEQVALDASCSQSLIFKHFESKEKLMDECFVKVCRDTLDNLRSVKIPKTLTKESLDSYAMELWGTNYTYLRSNNHIARAYLFFIGRGKKFPEGFDNPKDALVRILGDTYDEIVETYPDFLFVAGYLLVMANVVAAGPYREWISSVCEDPKERLESMLRLGVQGRG